MKIVKAELLMVDLKPKVKRTDAMQSFESQETPILKLTTESGEVGVGYTYTIGTGGSSIIALLKDHLLPKLIGRDSSMIQEIWQSLLVSTHATSVGAITSLSLAAIDTALWDLKCKRLNQPLYKVAGGAKSKLRLYTTEGGWLHLSTEELVRDALDVKSKGFCGSKIKIGSPNMNRDIERLEAVRKAVGDDYVIMTDCNQALKLSDAKQRASLLEHTVLSWIEEPFLAHDVSSHKQLAESTTIPVAVGESIYSIQHFKEYLENQAASIIQVDVARIGGITPWLKVAHMAECFNTLVCPHFLMELHISLCCAIENSKWLEYIPQLDTITLDKVKIEDGFAYPPQEPGLGIKWDWDMIYKETLVQHIIQ
ncbi:mandelate racemase/muconate lactonizing enzyme family protein [Zophobihabitans entericus]|uniref:Mandelate racemase/muconate lactonizing enzyme family protein n=1 Tax=Zophobihabitans entericus TaxID=1635327 RepID=A0A6G9IA88_9GAMM|nr:mandelate racemase/muconate lactonizing enzyme family protein [Zophobihabitans entericus]QIQ21148.1 mandelate racemase/muconate lactonizing enzyme family protein [Zophobihabitans entericus]